MPSTDSARPNSTTSAPGKSHANDATNAITKTMGIACMNGRICANRPTSFGGAEATACFGVASGMCRLP